MITDLGYALTALIGLFSLLLSARALLMPHAAAIGFGVPATPGLRPYMAVEASRDLAVGLVILALLTTAAVHAIGWALLAAAAIPVADGVIVLRTGGSRAIAFGVHHATAVVMVATAGLLLAA
jgi:Domain of unknown function (DUF4267)